MPLGWKNCTVGEFEEKGEIELTTGPFGTQLKAAEYVENGVPVINVRNIGFGNIRDEKLEYLSDVTVHRLSKHLLQSGDIVFGRKGAVERHAFIRSGHRGWFQGSDCLRLRVKTKKIAPRFLSYCFLTPDHQQWMINQCSHGATMSSLNQDILKRIPLRLPSFPTQRKIAAILSAYDDLIENNLRRIKILEEMAQNLYREWFVKFRFPGHQHARFTDSPLGRIPEGWEMSKVEGILKKVKRGVKIQKQDYAAEDLIPVVDQGKEFIGGYTDNTESLISDDLPLIVFGDHTRVLKFIDFPFACGADGTQLLKSNDERMPMTLFYYALSAIDLSDFAYARHFKFLKEEDLVLPNKSIADFFNQFVLPLREQTRSLMQKNTTLRRTRDLLLPRLISGEVDVSELDIAVPEEVL